VKKGLPFQGTVDKRQSLMDAFQAAVDFGVERSRLAITLTKSGETVLCVADYTSTGYRWFLFDSHGQSHEEHKLSYCKEYSSFQRLVDAYLAKYPFQDFGNDESIHSSMYNLFEALPIVLDTEERSDNSSSTPAAIRNSKGGGISVEESSRPPELSTSTTTSRVPDGILDPWRYKCSISREVMADPVVASDGHLYDRPQIEEHFRVRRADEMKRIATEEARANGAVPEESADDPTCCPGARPEIELTSPRTGLKILETLTPVLAYEQLIVELVNANALGMTDEEIQDWHERRQEKRIQDEKRRAEQEKADAEEEERKLHEAEAEERYRNRPPPVLGEPCRRIEVVRDIDNDSEKLGEHDLGICVALGGRPPRIPSAYANQDQRVPRCMVGCCAIPLSSSNWCDRCQRLVCHDCLSFGVSSFQPDNTNHTLHHVCFECVTQVVDVMDAEDTVTKERRAVILEKLEGHLAFLANRLSTKQDDVIRREMYDEFSSRLDEVRSAIDSSTSQLNKLKEEVRREEERASEAAADDGSNLNRKIELKEISEQLTNLGRQWDDLMQADEPTDEEELLRFVSRRSELADEYERMSLVLARLSAASESPAEVSAPTPAQIEADMATLGRLRGRLIELQRPAAAVESFEQQIARAVEQSEVASRLEELEYSISMAQSLAPPSNPSRQSAPSPSKGTQASKTTTCSTKDTLIRHLSRVQKARTPFLSFKRNRRQSLAVLVDNLRSCTLGSVGLNSILDQIVGLHLPLTPIIQECISQLRREITDASVVDPPASETQSLGSSQSSQSAETDEPHDDLSEDFLDVKAADEARNDIAAVGIRLESWPLHLGLQYPTHRMERQLESLQSTLRLRAVESKRAFEDRLNNEFQRLTERRDALEEEIALASRSLNDAQAHAEEAVAQRHARAAERRRREEAIRLAREEALREEERRAREADAALRRKHEADEKATRDAFARARGEGGGRAFGMQGDARMCSRCKTGPLYNENCTNLATHNASYRDNRGRLRRANECPNADCRWYNPHWHQWPYWDGTFGPH